MTDKASDIIGFEDIPNINDCITPNTANDFMTLPYPTIALELSNGLKEFVTPISSIDFKFFIFFKGYVSHLRDRYDIKTTTP